MTWSMQIPMLLPVLLLPAVLLRLARTAARAGRPERAARTLAGGALITAVSGAVCLALLAATLVDDLPAFARYARLSTAGGRPLPEPVPDPVAVAAAVVLIWVGVVLSVRLRRRRIVDRELRAVGSARAGVVVADWDSPRAVAVPARRGRRGYVLVTTGLLRLLDVRERTAVLAHERAHVLHGHHRTTALAVIATSVNPLLRPVESVVCLLVERSADEDAARMVADRRLVARTIAKVALAADGSFTSLGFSGSSTRRRVEALVRPASDRRQPGRTTVGCTVIVAALSLVVAAMALGEFTELFLVWLPTGWRAVTTHVI